MLNFLPASPSRLDVDAPLLVLALPAYPVAIANGLSASSPAVAVSKLAAYHTRNVWI